MENCIFCKIVNGEIPCYKVWEDENYLAFLTIRPHVPGHTLFIPKQHQIYLYDLNSEQIGSLMAATKPIAEKLAQVLKPATGKVGIIVAGLEVPHVHIHLIPMNSESDLEFSSARDATSEQLQALVAQLNDSSFEPK